MDTNETVLDIIRHALSRIYNETGIAVSDISADWIHVGTCGNPYQHALAYIEFGKSYVDQPGGRKE